MIFWPFLGNFSCFFVCFLAVLLYFWPFHGIFKANFCLFFQFTGQPYCINNHIPSKLISPKYSKCQFRHFACLFNPASEASGVVLNLTGDLTFTFGAKWSKMIIFDRSAIIAGNPRFESPIKVRGSKTYLSDGPRRWVGEKAKKIISKGRILPYENAHFSSFSEFCKTGDFDRQISPW